MRKDAKIHPWLLAAGVSKDADFRLLDTHANPPQWDSPKNSCGFIESLFATTSYILSMFVSQPTKQLVTKMANEDDPQRTEEQWLLNPIVG